MINLATTFLFLGVCLPLFSQITLIPDPNFEQQLISLGIDSDQIINGQVATADVVNVTELFIGGSNISDLTGIEDFESLEILFCEGNFLTSIDISDLENLTNLTIPFNQLTELDVSNNHMLQVLGVVGNLLTTLNVENNLNLELLLVGFSNGTSNNIISSLNLSNNSNLDFLAAEDISLEALDVKSGNNALLTRLEVTDNPNLTCIQVDDATAANNGTGVYGDWEVDPQVSFSENCVLGIAENNTLTIALYPNPIKVHLFLSYEGELARIQIIDMLGSIVYNQEAKNVTRVDLSAIATGSYFVKITSPQGVFVEKILKQ